MTVSTRSVISSELIANKGAFAALSPHNQAALQSAVTDSMGWITNTMKSEVSVSSGLVMPIVTQIGNAFLAQQPDVMDAVQRERRKAQQFGYLRTNAQIVVGGGPYITILPVNPAFICVPYYDPAIVFFAPRAGFAVGGAISFNFGISIGLFFRPWGWGPGLGRFDWGGHAVFINNAAWGRNWANRGAYIHPYAGIRRPAPGVARPAEAHRLEGRSPVEREAARTGQRAPKEEHRGR